MLRLFRRKPVEETFTEVPLDRIKGLYVVGVINSYVGPHGAVLGDHMTHDYFFLNTDEMKAYRLSESDWKNMKIYVKGKD